jgi:predicted alpha/beta-fold hydrolase
MGVRRPAVPHLLVLHGLEGTIRATYAHGLLEQARKRGWSGDLLLFRSCDGELNEARRLYHSGETTDLAHVVRWLHSESPLSPLVICGVSLGGNVLLKWLGEEGSALQSMVVRAAAVSVPFNLARGSRMLETGFSRLYARHFLRTLIPKAVAKEAQYPGSIDIAAARNARTFWEFDDAATAPLHGFRNAADYYDRSSSLAFLDRVAVPTLLFCALNDPFIPLDVLNEVRSGARRSAPLLVDFTSSGGHVGWVEGSIWPGSYFMDRRVVSFLESGV